MPQINRIRVNNIKYNFGTQAYDDFLMKPFCRNTLYDLANGGGKSVLMLLLLQNVIPNCTLDEKQPIEKLFRSNEGSKTIHSLIEWKLDDEDVQNGFRYMTTGFCAKKAVDAEEETKDTASIEYFNYCVFYRDYNGNDIRNLPLVKEKERITYSGLRRYLKELEKDSSLMIRIFDKKGEYQNFIAQYGIYESEWEIIRGINKTEGHVRTYFESNYKTTRKVVEELLIEEILGTSFRRKAGREDAEDVMSKTLLDMKDKLSELARQKDAIKSYDRQTEILSEFSERVSYLGSVYVEQKEIKTLLNRVYYAAKHYLSEREQSVEEKKKQEEELLQEIKKCEAELLSAGLSENRELARKLAKEESAMSLAVSQNTEQKEALEALFVRNECANDYLAYLEEKKKRDEMTVTLQAITEQDGLQAEISALVGTYKKLSEQKETELRSELLKAESALSGALLRRKTAQNARKDIEKELAVTDIVIEQGKKDLTRLYAKQKEKKSEIGLLITEEANGRLAECLQQKQKSEAEKKAEREENEKRKTEQEEILAAKKAAEAELVRFQSGTEYRQQLDSKLAEDTVRADRLAEAYGEKDYRKLYQEVRNRYLQASFELKNQRDEQKKAKKRRQEIEAGELFSSSAAATRVKEYIVTRYNKKAITGAEYLSDKSKEEQESLLKQYPGLLSAVLTEGYAEAAGDSSLADCIPEGELVILLRPETLRGGKEIYLREKMLLLCREEAALLEEKNRQKEILRLLRIEEEAENSINRIQSLTETYEEDESFLSLFVSRYYTSMYGKKTDYGTESPEDLLKEKLERITERLRILNEKIEEYPEKIEKLSEQSFRCEQEASVYREVIALSKQIEEKEAQEKETSERRGKLTEWANQSIQEVEKAETDFEAKEAKVSSLKEQIEELLHTRENFRIYEQEGVEAPFHGEISELLILIDGKLAALNSESSSLEDKRRLMDSYVAAMNRLLRSIRTRGLSVAELTELYEKEELYETSEEELLRRKGEIEALAKKDAELARNWKELQEKRFRLEGKNEQAEAAIVDKYGCFTEISLTGEALSDFVKKLQNRTKELQNEQKELQKEQEKLREELSEYILIRNEIERMFDGTEELAKECGHLENQVRLSDIYKEAREKYSACAKEIAKRQEEFYRNRQTTMETLKVLSAEALAEEIGGSILMPKDSVQTEEITRGLNEVMECLQLEKSRIEAGLLDMETIKENFESQCLQRCLNIKADLERLPKLSKILLDGEQIPIISLQIPYVKEETFTDRMSEYIDRVVRSVDEITSQPERIKYIRQALSYKKLFSVIVTDMNGIKLLLYKRERIKEQSRLLPYEEAVGSTGQSQGIYIQFLIAIIHYISSIYSPKGDSAGLSKVIFIDNPFGAAKDVYIWEPIFELLRANRVQLIVPARGVTPAITGRFDVNYVLGQKLIDGRQQTVVVDYCSQVETEAMEFIPLQFEQTSLDISEV